MYLTVAAYTDPLLARLVHGRLEAEGIVARVDDEHTALAYWDLRQALGGVRVRVAATQFDAARQIVRGIDAGEFALEDEAGGGGRIPACRESLSSRLAYALLFLLSLPVPFSRGSARGE
ncbi:putative signal transducing protein [Agrilutibacter solisilvae]|uniref:DUF2007 domain-containing protein n=1 Tax=Agrilutibacter solisilvae TaxID=2763317 RepID=A0A974Y0U1_9GAMM|nr:DUF2007 domain-containing protein [Lysobacter solisilvae]QSX79229.1 DUF2007 domain-containing protein [Lysobacter solisilvae]